MLIVQGVPPPGGVKQWWGWKTSYFEAKCVNISKTLHVGDTSTSSYYNDQCRKLHMYFRLTLRSMTLGDLELYKFEF